MRGLTIIVAVALTAFIAGNGLADDRRWTAVPEDDLKDLPTIRDIGTGGSDVFAVGEGGSSITITPVRSPVYTLPRL